GNISRAYRELQRANREAVNEGVEADLPPPLDAAAEALARDFRTQLDTLDRLAGELTRPEPAAVAAALGPDSPGPVTRLEGMAGALSARAADIRAAAGPAEEEKS